MGVLSCQGVCFGDVLMRPGQYQYIVPIFAFGVDYSKYCLDTILRLVLGGRDFGGCAGVVKCGLEFFFVLPNICMTIKVLV